jgi:hypothetical protein
MTIITNRQALEAELQNIVVNGEIVNKALIDVGIEGVEDYKQENGRLIGTAAINILQTMLGSMDISEGGFSITMRSTVIPLRITALAKKWGLDNVIAEMQPTIKFVRKW